MFLSSFAFVVNSLAYICKRKRLKIKTFLKAKTKIKISNKFQLTIFFLIIKIV